VSVESPKFSSIKCVREPQKTVVELAETLLEQAKSGDLQFLFVVTCDFDGASTNAWSHNCLVRQTALLGAIEKGKMAWWSEVMERS